MNRHVSHKRSKRRAEAEDNRSRGRAGQRLRFFKHQAINQYAYSQTMENPEMDGRRRIVDHGGRGDKDRDTEQFQGAADIAPT